MTIKLLFNVNNINKNQRRWLQHFCTGNNELINLGTQTYFMLEERTFHNLATWRLLGYYWSIKN